MAISIFRITGILILLTFFARNVDACDYPYKVAVGDTVNCSGVVLSEKQVVDAANRKKELRLKNLKIAEYEGLEELYEMRHKSYKRELNDTRNELKWLQIKSTAGYVISFSLGAIVTGMIAKEVLK
jgi:hypothetical protein